MSAPAPAGALPAFVDRLLDEKGLAALDPAVRAELHADLLQRVEQFMNAALVASLAPQDLPGFEQALQSGDRAATSAYLESHIPEVATVVAAALLRFRDTYLGA